MSNSLWPQGLQHTRLLCPPLSARVCSNSYPLSQWCYLTISSSVAPFFCLQYFPGSRSYPMSWLLTLGGQSIRASASASVLPANIQVWFPLGLKSLKSSSVFSKMKRSLVFADRLGGFFSVFLIVLLGTIRPPSLRPFEGCLINVFCQPYFWS